jgi:phenylalanyl-tRNA synthetase alpha chain
MQQELDQLVTEARAQIADAPSLPELDAIRVAFLGKKGKVTALLKGLGKLTPEERPKAGAAVNQAKQTLQGAIEARKEILQADLLQGRLAAETLDVSLSGRGQRPGNLHPVTQARRRIEDFFSQMGFSVIQGPEVEQEFYNFEALNFPDHHPAKDMQDTFYFGDGRLLRTHTSTLQIRAMEKGEPPFRILAVGRVYRCDSDLTHTPMFHQVEGLMVGEDVSMSGLKNILQQFFRYFFEQDDLSLRLRPSYFPFTEPSAEVDIQCVFCHGEGCRVCSQSGWLEVMGCGMVHPNVLKAVNVDPEAYTGWAFGGGIDRMAMLRYAISDLRVLFENDVRFLQQF